MIQDFRIINDRTIFVSSNYVNQQELNSYFSLNVLNADYSDKQIEKLIDSVSKMIDGRELKDKEEKLIDDMLVHI